VGELKGLRVFEKPGDEGEKITVRKVLYSFSVNRRIRVECSRLLRIPNKVARSTLDGMKMSD